MVMSIAPKLQYNIIYIQTAFGTLCRWGGSCMIYICIGCIIILFMSTILYCERSRHIAFSHIKTINFVCWNRNWWRWMKKIRVREPSLCAHNGFGTAFETEHYCPPKNIDDKPYIANLTYARVLLCIIVIVSSTNYQDCVGFSTNMIILL